MAVAVGLKFTVAGAVMAFKMAILDGASANVTGAAVFMMFTTLKACPLEVIVCGMVPVKATPLLLAVKVPAVLFQFPITVIVLSVKPASNVPAADIFISLKTFAAVIDTVLVPASSTFQ